MKTTKRAKRQVPAEGNSLEKYQLAWGKFVQHFLRPGVLQVSIKLPECRKAQMFPIDVFHLNFEGESFARELFQHLDPELCDLETQLAQQSRTR